jgi:acyl dehydratase
VTEEGKLSEAEWHALVDKHMIELNKRRGTIIIPPPPHVLSESEYQMGINHRVVTEDLIRHFADAVGDPNPLWRDPAYARGTRWGGIIAPPAFEYCIANCDSAGVGPEGTFLLPGFNLFAAGNKHEYFGVIRPGDEFRIVDKYLGAEEKTVKGKTYRLFLDSGQRTYINQREEVVAVATGRRVMTGTPPGKMDGTQNQLYKNVKRHHFTKQELDLIHRHYDDELKGKGRRGKEVRYWEDVVEGEELKPVAKGPFDITDACSAILVEYNYAFALKWAMMRKAIANYPVDPDTGEYRYRRDWHFQDSLAQAMGLPYAFQIGKYSEMLLAHVVSNWTGDDGFVKTLDFQLRHINIMGDMNWLKGRVVKKYIKDGEPLVELEIWSENQDGTIITRGTATVRLMSRSG